MLEIFWPNLLLGQVSAMRNLFNLSNPVVSVEVLVIAIIMHDLCNLLDSALALSLSSLRPAACCNLL